MTRQEIQAARMALFVTLITPHNVEKFGEAVRLLIRLRKDEEAYYGNAQ